MDRANKGLHYTNMSSIPSYALYGESIAPADTWMHWETITSRSSLHGFRIAPHRHEQLTQLLFVANGTAEVTFDDQVTPVSGPTLLIIPPVIVHGFRFSDDVLGHVLTLVSRDLMELLADAPQIAALCQRPSILDLTGLDGSGAAVADAFIDLIAEGDRLEPGQRLALKARAALLMVQIHRTALLAERQTDVKGTRAETLARSFQALVDDRYGKSRTIGDYATALGISSTHLNRVCNHVFGTSALNVIERRIVLEAQRYLQFSVLSIKEIAFLLGYQDAAYFSRFFRRRVGTSPQDYRNGASVTG